MDCCVCGKRMDKLTRTQFSYNTKEGACPECQGLGQTLKVDRTGAVDERRSLEDGAVRFGHRNTLNTRRVRFMRLCGIMGSLYSRGRQSKHTAICKRQCCMRELPALRCKKRFRI